MKNIFWLIIVLICTVTVRAQERRHHFPLWTFHDKNVTVHGLNVGLIDVDDEPHNTVTNGVRAELIGFGVLLPLIPYSPIVEDEAHFKRMYGDVADDRINGLNLSLSGSACNCHVNGASAGYMGQILRQVNGVSATMALNFVQISNGLQLSVMVNSSFRNRGLQLGGFNSSVESRGVQIGITNFSEDLRGFQIGLWNRNGRRSLPLFNWQFKPAKKPAGERTS